MDKIIFPIKNELENFEKKLKEVVISTDNFLTCDLEKFMFASAKRLRPIFIFLFSKILKIENPLVCNIALITELIHNASLLHDDIIDEEAQRRNHPTFYKKFGSKIAVLEGDLLLSLALEQISQTNMEISKIFAKKIKATIQGEIQQNENTNKITDIDLYLQKTFAKTGNLFMAGLEALFVLSCKNDALINFMQNYALAFQIKNDIDNFKINSSDFKNGNYTLPVIYSFMENETENFDKYIEISYQKVKELTQTALQYLEKIDNSQYKKALIELTKHTLGS